MPTYILRSKDIAQRMVDYIKAVAGPAAASGKPIVVEICEYQAKRSSEQNRLLWALLTEIAEQVEVSGKRFSKEAWHEHFKDQFAPKQEGPNGLVAVSTSQMTKQQFQEYVTRIECYATQELGVEFSTV